MLKYSTGEGCRREERRLWSRRKAPAQQGQRLLCPKERRVDPRPSGRDAKLDPVERFGFSHGS